MLHFEHDPEADAVYIQLRQAPYSRGEDLDDVRRVDYGDDGQPIGIELLGVSSGVNLDGLPQRTRIKKLLAEHRIKIATPTPHIQQ